MFVCHYKLLIKKKFYSIQIYILSYQQLKKYNELDFWNHWPESLNSGGPEEARAPMQDFFLGPLPDLTPMQHLQKLHSTLTSTAAPTPPQHLPQPPHLRNIFHTPTAPSILPQHPPQQHEDVFCLYSSLTDLFKLVTENIYKPLKIFH